MTRYRIANSKNKENYIKYFQDSSEARHFIINHLDLSLEWEIELCPKDTFISNKIKG